MQEPIKMDAGEARFINKRSSLPLISTRRNVQEQNQEEDDNDEVKEKGGRTIERSKELKPIKLNAPSALQFYSESADYNKYQK